MALASTSFNVQVSCQTEKIKKDEWAATVIQSAFRAFLVLNRLFRCAHISLPTYVFLTLTN